jgi:hypothetical protein
VPDCGHYFQFPLCALAFGMTERDRLDNIITYGFVSAGMKMYGRLDARLREEKAGELRQYAGTPNDYLPGRCQHVAAMLGAKEIGITVGSVADSLKRFAALDEFRTAFERINGKDAAVRIAKDWVFEARDGKGISYRELAVLCSLYSSIGAKDYPVRVTRDQVRRRMLGYKSAEVAKRELPNRQDGAKLLTIRQISSSLEKLHERRFFARARANERQTYYSNRLTQEELERKLIESKTYKDDFRQKRIQRDTSLMATIKARKAAIKANMPIIVDIPKVDAPAGAGSNDGRSAAATESAGMSAGVAA